MNDPQAVDQTARNYTAQSSPAHGPVTHVDPVCGMEIEEADSVGTVEHNGVTYYFCAESCLERFKDNPDEVLNPALTPAAPLTAPAGGRVETTFPKDPQNHRDPPGPFSNCG